MVRMERCLLLLLLLSVCGITQVAQGRTILSVNWIGFSNPLGRIYTTDCCDGEETNNGCTFGACDPVFTVCLDYANGDPNNASSCPLYKQTTASIADKNVIDFTNPTDRGRDFQTPLLIPLDTFQSQVMLKIAAYDDDTGDQDPLMDQFVFSYTQAAPFKSVDVAQYASSTRTGTINIGQLYAGSPPTTLSIAFAMYCEKNWYGANCSTNCVPNNDCNGHYNCNEDNGSKLCLAGWTGANCNIRDPSVQSTVCPNPSVCKYGGDCINVPATSTANSSSYCCCREGFTTADCSRLRFCPSTNPCLHGGTCQNVNVVSAMCNCIPPYTGVICDILNPCAGVTCLNGGTCSVNGTSAVCNCTTGFTGALCGAIADPCISNPCQNSATCRNLLPSTYAYTCSCAPGYAGPTCSVDIDECASSPCAHGGICTTPSVNMYRCTCLAGYTGPTCNMDIDECASSPCTHGGGCSTPSINMYSCTCVPGYMGTNCEIEINGCASMPCSFIGALACFKPGVNMYQCICLPGYTGTNCDIDVDECASSPCTHGGGCSTPFVNMYFCTCVAGTMGTNCEIDVNECASSPCKTGAICSTPSLNMYQCACAPGYTGTNCEIDIDECASMPCANGSTCVTPSVNKYFCICLPGYTGIRCDVDMDECTPNPCLNTGTCNQLTPPPRTGDRFRCTCPSAWTGHLCENATSGCCCVNGDCVPYLGNTFCTCNTGWTGRCCDALFACPPGYTGAKCEIDIDECASVPCKHGGGCTQVTPPSNGVFFTCACPAAWAGSDCSLVNPCYSTPCMGGATCFYFGTTYSCQCPSGYSGINCEIRLQCALDNNATIVDVGCPAFNASRFQQAVASNLTALCDIARPYLICAKTATLYCPVNRTYPIWGKTNDYFIACCLSTGLTNSCPVQAPSCLQKPCENNGTCRNTTTPAGYSCNCTGGFYGTRCEIDVNECASSPCASSATCENLANAFRCRCAPGYGGNTCQNRYFNCSQGGLLPDPLECDWFFQCSAINAVPVRNQCANVLGRIQLLFDTTSKSCLPPSLFKLGLSYSLAPGCVIH